MFSVHTYHNHLSPRLALRQIGIPRIPRVPQQRDNTSVDGSRASPQQPSFCTGCTPAAQLRFIPVAQYLEWGVLAFSSSHFAGITRISTSPTLPRPPSTVHRNSYLNLVSLGKSFCYFGVIFVIIIVCCICMSRKLLPSGVPVSSSHSAGRKLLQTLA